MTKQDQFRRRHPDWKHQAVPFGPTEAGRLIDAWKAILETQNGRDVDEAHPGDLARFLTALSSRLPDRPGSMLIVGCGTGEEIIDARSLGWDVQGVTLAPMNQAWCKEQHGLDVDFEDFHLNNYCGRQFDVLVGRQVWEHSWAPFIFAIECARVLKPGGKVILETPNCRDFIYESSTVHHVFCPTPYQGCRMLEKAGFVDVVSLNGADSLLPFVDEHRDDVGGSKVTFIGTRWRPSDEAKINPTIRAMTSR